MKYIIAAKSEAKGNSIDDIKSPLRVTEIATELVITRLRIIDMLRNKLIDKSDCIVTASERKCLYENFFDNVIDYHEFMSLKVPKHRIVDLLEVGIFQRMSGGPIESRIIPYKPFYQNWERDKDLILNINFSDLSDYDLSEPFVALVIRKRAAWSEKNMSDEFWEETLLKLKHNNIKTFVFGKETDGFSDGKNIQYVKNYRDWCSIVNHSNCKSIGSTMTGGVYPALIIGNPNIVMTIIDNTRLMAKHAGDPSFYDNCINFSKIKIEYINEIPKIKDFYERLERNL
jgi:hypothetical protein